MLDPPVTRLVAACGDIVAPLKCTVWVRDPASPAGAGVWTPTTLPGISYQGAGMVYARRLFLAKDPRTGVQNIFAGVVHGRTSELRRGAWDAGAGTIVWDQVSELDGPGRIMASANLDSRLYVAVGSDGIPGNGIGGLFRRVDGPNPRWEEVWEWEVPEPGLGYNLRGLTPVPRPDGGPGEILIAEIESQRKIVRIDPAGSGAAKVKLDLDGEDYFEARWGEPRPGGYKHFHYAPYNDMLWATDPASGERVLLIGTWTSYPKLSTPERMNAWMLIRHNDGRYEHALVMDPAHPLPRRPGLYGIRTIAPSPFAEELGRVWYFGGVDAGAPRPQWHETGWIYRGEFPSGLIDKEKP